MSALDFSEKKVVSVTYTTGGGEASVKLVAPRFETIAERLFLVGQTYAHKGVEAGVAWENVVTFTTQ